MGVNGYQNGHAIDTGGSNHYMKYLALIIFQMLNNFSDGLVEPVRLVLFSTVRKTTASPSEIRRATAWERVLVYIDALAVYAMGGRISPSRKNMEIILGNLHSLAENQTKILERKITRIPLQDATSLVQR